MRLERLEDVLDECLGMIEKGTSISDCVARHPEYAEELRAQLRVASTLMSARPHVQPNSTAQVKGRTLLLAAVTQQQEAIQAGSALALVAPFGALVDGARRLVALPLAPSLVLAALLLAGATLGTLAAADAGGFRSAITDAVRPSHSDDDHSDDGIGPGPDGSGGPDGPDGQDLPGAAVTPLAPTMTEAPAPTATPDTPVSPTAPVNQPDTPVAPPGTPATPPAAFDGTQGVPTVPTTPAMPESTNLPDSPN